MEHIITDCHYSGLKYKDIVEVINHRLGVRISLRHLKRVLAKLGLYRRKNYSAIDDVIEFVENQHLQSGCQHGYRCVFVLNFDNVRKTYTTYGVLISYNVRLTSDAS